MRYSINESKLSDVYTHLQLCDKDFQPPLSTRTNIKKYSEKIISKSVRFELWENKKLIGLLSAYNNGKSIYITNVSVLREHQGQGIGLNLVNMCIQYGKDIGLEYLSLEVNENNQKAVNLYVKSGFKRDDNLMKLII